MSSETTGSNDFPLDASAGLDRYSINFSAPWESKLLPQCMSFNGSALTKNPDLVHSIEKLMIDRTRLHELFIQEQARNTRLHSIIAAVLFLCACLVVVFAPEQRQATTHWIGAAMVIVAAGVAGFSRVWGKSKLGEFGADRVSKQLGAGNQ